MRQFARNDGDDIEAPVELVGAPPAGAPDARRRLDPLARAGQYGLDGAVAAGAGLHLDEGEDPAAAGDEIDLAAGRAGAAGEDAVALQLQPQGGDIFGAAALALALAALQLALQSSPSPSRNSSIRL